jgi:hypothetical protein
MVCSKVRAAGAPNDGLTCCVGRDFRHEKSKFSSLSHGASQSMTVGLATAELAMLQTPILQSGNIFCITWHTSARSSANSSLATRIWSGVWLAAQVTKFDPGCRKISACSLGLEFCDPIGAKRRSCLLPEFWHTQGPMGVELLARGG